jgi:hypothetical protein
MTTTDDRADLLSKLGLNGQNKAALSGAGDRKNRAGDGESRWSDGGDHPHPAR